MEEKRRKELEILRDSMILEDTNSFITEYNLLTGEWYVDPMQKKFIQGDWEKELHADTFQIEKIFVRDDLEDVRKFLDFSTLKKGERRKTKARIYVKPHLFEWFRMSLTCFENEEGETIKILLIFSHAENELETARQLKFLLSKDSLTHLPNLESFIDMTEHMFTQYPDKSYAFIRLDIEKFHIVNQMFGKKEGDNILRYVGVKLQECMEQEDESTYCHISADNLCVCMEANQEKMDAVIESLQENIKIYPINFELVIAFGIYLTTKADIENRVPISTLLDRAAVAQRKIKNNYMVHVGWYDETLRKQDEAEQIVVSEMKNALESNQFQVYLQPKCSVPDGRIVGSEALVRWIHPQRGMISPGEFIPIFEKNGFISEVDVYVCRLTCQILRKWIDSGMKVYPVSVNLSRSDLYNPGIFEAIESCVKEYQIPNELIEFEVTESAFVSDNVPLHNLVNQLRKQHHAVLMDDFGSGYSSLNCLKDISVDILKVDLKFLPVSQENGKASVILASVVDMAMKLGLQVIIEGVETKEQLECVEAVGCKIVQGYYFYRPMPVEEYESLIMEE